MADINKPIIGDLSAAQKAVQELEVSVKKVQSEEAVAFDKLSVGIEAAGTKNQARRPAQMDITDLVGAEAANRRAAAAATNSQAVAVERLAAAQMRLFNVAGGTHGQSAQMSLDALAAGRFSNPGWRPPPPPPPPAPPHGGMGDDQFERRTNLVRSLGQMEMLSADQSAQGWQRANASITSYNNALTRHGYLSSETIQAAQRGELTYREWGNQIGGTAAKFAAWTAVSIPIFGAIDAFKHLYDGAVQTSQGIAFVERSITGLNTGQARSQIEALSQKFNVPISDAAQAMGVMARQFHNQGDAAQAAQAPLFAQKLGDLSVDTAAQRFTGIAKAFKLPASDLVAIYDQVAQAQRRFGVMADQSTTALATAGGVWHQAGGSLSQLLTLTTALNRVTGGGATGANIATMISYSSAQLNNNASVQQRAWALGINPTKGIVSVFDQMIEKAKKDPQDISAIASIFGTRGGKYLPALLANPAFVAQVSKETAPGPSKGVAQYELDKMLSGAGQQISRMGVLLQNIGANLAGSGALTSLGLMLKLLNESLAAVNNLVGAFNQIPGPIRQAITLGGELVLIQKALRAANIGQGLSGNGGVLSTERGLTARGYLHNWLTPDQAKEDAKALKAQAGADIEAMKSQASSDQTRARASHWQSYTAAQNYSAGGGDLYEKRAATMSDEQMVLSKMYTDEQLQSLQSLKASATAASKKAITDTEQAQLSADTLVQMKLAKLAGTYDQGPFRVSEAATLPHVGGGDKITRSGVPVNIVSAADAPLAGGNLPVIMGAGGATAEAAAIEKSGFLSKLRSMPSMEQLQLGGMMGMGGKGGGGLMGGFMTLLMGQMAAQMVGGAIGGSAGHTVQGIGSFAAGGAALGSVIPGLGPVFGALAGAGLGAGISLVHKQAANQAKFIKSQTDVGSFAQFQNAVLTAKSLPFSAADYDQAAARGTLTEQQTITDQQAHQLAKNPTRMASFQSTAFLVTMANKQLAEAKTYAEKQAVMAKFKDAIDRSYEALAGNASISQKAIATLQGKVAVANTGSKDFLSYYNALGGAQPAYDKYVKDVIAEQGLGAKGPGGQSLAGEALQAAKFNEDLAASQIKLSRKAGVSAGNSAKYVKSADNYANAAHALTSAYLDQNTTDLSNALTEATSPEAAMSAFDTAIANAKKAIKADPQKAKAEIAGQIQQQADYKNTLLGSQLGLANAYDPSAIDVAQRSIVEQGKVVANDIKAYGRNTSKTLDAMAQQQNNYLAILNAEQGQITAKGALSAAQQGNYVPGADAARVTAARQAIDALMNSKMSPAYKRQQLTQLQANLAQVQLAYYNDVTQYANDLSAAQANLAGSVNNDPLQIAKQSVKSAQAVVNEGRFKTEADKLNAEAKVNQARQNYQSAVYTHLQTEATLGHQSTAMQIAVYSKFANSIKHDVALKNQVLTDILNLELQNSGSFELNVGGLALPTIYQARRAEHALRSQQAGRSQQVGSVIVHAPITVTGHNSKEAAQVISRHIQTAIKTSVRASQRSSVQR